MTDRNQLPNRRPASVVAFSHGERPWVASFGYFEDGRLAELFLDTAKESAIADAAREAALIASLALQFGCPLDVLRHALAGRDVSPIGAALALAGGLAMSQDAAVSAPPAADTGQNMQRSGDT